MGRSKKPLPLLEGVTIEAVAAEGKCLFHWNDLVVFVPFCVPGDVCDIQIRRKKHSFAEGEVVHFIEFSKVRATPFCRDALLSPFRCLRWLQVAEPAL